MVLTIEPGIYFIESLWHRGVKGSSASTSTGRKLKPETVRRHSYRRQRGDPRKQRENMTRDLKLA